MARKKAETTFVIEEEGGSELSEYYDANEFPEAPKSQKASQKATSWLLGHKLETFGIIMLLVLGIVVAVSMTGSDTDGSGEGPSNVETGVGNNDVGGGSAGGGAGTARSPSMSPTVFKLTTPSLDSSKDPTDTLPTVSSSAPTKMNAPTVSPVPSAKPVYTNLLQILEDLSPGIDFKDRSTPQAKAANWLMYRDKFDLNVDSPNILQRYALGVLYFATGGGLESASWKKCSAVPDKLSSQFSSGTVDCVFNFGKRVICAEIDAFENCSFMHQDGYEVSSKRFLSPIHECNWYGVECDMNDRVTSVVLEDNNLMGVIPRELVLLNVLNKLDLSTNKLTGEIRSHYFPLSLKHLLIDFNYDLTGAIDTSKFCSPPMFELFVDCNMIECGSCCGCRSKPGPSPTKTPSKAPSQSPTKSPTKAPTKSPTISPSAIPTAVSSPTISPYPTTVTPTIFVSPQRAALMALYESAGGDGWSGKGGWMTDSFECSWPGVKCEGGVVVELDLAKKNLVGDIPSEIGDLHGLVLLDLSENKLSSSIPPEIGLLEELEFLRLFGNPLDGEIPVEIGELVNLKVLVVYDTADTAGPTLSGSIPSEIGNCKALRNMALQGNALSGVIPDELYGLTALTNLRLQRNQLEGEISPLIGNLKLLKRFRIDTNKMTGALPEEMGDMLALEDLLLHRNDFTGVVPDALCDLAKDEKLEDFTIDCTSDDIECECCTECF